MKESTTPAQNIVTSPNGSFIQVVLVVSTLAVSWLGMQAVHELGHVVGAWLTGGRVERVVLQPLSISRTDVAPNPRPLWVVWAGPSLGVLLPIGGWLLAAWRKWSAAFVCRFFAGFCLVANGLYIAIGSFWQIGDSGVMLNHAPAMWPLWLFGAVTVPAGFALWNGQGRDFGLGRDPHPITPRIAWGTFAAAVLLATVGVMT
jgi:hypothetical protein